MIKTFSSANEFLKETQTLLEEREAENNLILGISSALSSNINYYSKQTPILLSVFENGHCVCACLQTPPQYLILYAEKEHLEKSVHGICEYLLDNKLEIPGIIAPQETAEKFIEIWSSKKSILSITQMNQMVYKLEKLNHIPLSSGKLRQAKISDLNLVADWVGKFSTEVFESISKEEAIRFAKQKIQEKAFYLWETDKPVSIAGWTRPTQNGVTVAFVYTPEKYRRKGYASSCVFKLSEFLLTQYKFCSLFTDLSNNTSNNIYKEIGYHPINKVLQCKFIDIEVN